MEITITKEMTMREALAIVAVSSEDPDTRTACMIKTVNGRFIHSSNRLPSRVEKTQARLERPAKYSFIMHAEQRAIAIAAKEGWSLRRATMSLNWFPCSSCAQSIVESGISTVICDREKYEARKDDPRYGFADAMSILTEGCVDVEWLES